MIRPLLNEVLGHVVHARLNMESLQETIVNEMRAGYRPTYRGHAWDNRQYQLLEAGAHALEAAFHLLKAVQWPEMTEDRIGSVLVELEQVQDSYRQRQDGNDDAPKLRPGDK